MSLFLKFCLKMLGGTLAFWAAIILLLVVCVYAFWLIPLTMGAWILACEWDFYKRYGQHFHGSYASVKHTERGE